MNGKLTVLLAVLFFGNIFGFAQSHEKEPALTSWVLEVNYYQGSPPTYQQISVPGGKPKWAWYARFRQMPNFQTSPERPPVRAVKFVPFLEGETVRINVTVYTGLRGFEKEEKVATYTAAKNQRIVVKELANFGVEPFEIKVVERNLVTSPLPTLEIRTSSLKVAGINPQLSTRPTVRITFLNASQKDVIAFSFATALNGKRGISGTPQDERGKALIKAGETLVREMPVSVDPSAPAEEQSSIFTIQTVIFADGSYEGDPGNAFGFLFSVGGRKQQIERIISLIRTVENARQPVELDEFIRQASGLETTIDSKKFEDYWRKFSFPLPPRIRWEGSMAEIAANHVKMDFLNELESYRPRLKSRDARPILKAIGKEYQDWLERLP